MTQIKPGRRRGDKMPGMARIDIVGGGAPFTLDGLLNHGAALEGTLVRLIRAA